MFAKVLILCVVAVAALAEDVKKLPEGLHPALCPNYPLCDREILARHTPEGIPIPDWEYPYARMMPAAFPYVAQTSAFRYPSAIPYVANPGIYEYPYARMMPHLVTVPIVTEKNIEEKKTEE